MCIKSEWFLCHPDRSWEFHHRIKYQCPGVTVPNGRRFGGRSHEFVLPQERGDQLNINWDVQATMTSSIKISLYYTYMYHEKNTHTHTHTTYHHKFKWSRHIKTKNSIYPLPQKKRFETSSGFSWGKTTTKAHPINLDLQQETQTGRHSARWAGVFPGQKTTTLWTGCVLIFFLVWKRFSFDKNISGWKYHKSMAEKQG